MDESELKIIKNGPYGYYLNPKELTATEAESFDMTDEIEVKRSKRVLRVGSVDDDFTLPFDPHLGLRFVDADGNERYAYFDHLGTIYKVTDGARANLDVAEFKMEPDSYFWQFITLYTFKG